MVLCDDEKLLKLALRIHKDIEAIQRSVGVEGRRPRVAIHRAARGREVRVGRGKRDEGGNFTEGARIR